MSLKEMSHLLKRTKKSCIKLIRKLSTKQIFLKRLEEDISADIDISIEAKERKSNENEIDSSKKSSSYFDQAQKKEKNENGKGINRANAKILSHLEEEDEDEDEEENQNTAILQSLTQKLFLTADGYEFQRLEQLRSDTASEIVPYDCSYFAATAAVATKKPTVGDESNLEVVFEKVKYKEDVRYLRHTPSTASLDNYTINDDIDYYISNSISTATTTTNTTFTHNNNCNMSNLNDSLFTNRGLETHRSYFNSQNHLNTNLLPVNVSLGCKTDGNYHQFIIGEERDCFYKLTPVVRWDINGNSLEDDFDQFDQFNKNAYNSPTKSSLRSSSTTLETWLDDE